jgi:hypothetical protein
VRRTGGGGLRLLVERTVLVPALAVALAACGGDDDTDPDAEWRDTLAAMAPDVNGSEVVDIGGDHFAATGEGDDVAVWSFDGRRWSREATFPTYEPTVGPDSAELVEDDFTGDDSDDFLIPLRGRGLRGLVLTSHTGSWAPAVFATSDGHETEVDELTADGQTLVSSRTDCDPSCAEGQRTDVEWRYDTDRFVVADERLR